MSSTLSLEMDSTLSRPLNPNKQSYDSKSQVSILQFAWMGYMLVSGGPFGMELLVQSGGPLLSFIGLLVMPFIYELPQALMTAEMSNIMPENGGYIVWVFRAFGPFWGYINGYNAAFCNLFDNAIYPALVAQYLNSFKPQIFQGAILIVVKLTVVVGCAILNILSLNDVGNVSSIIGFMSIAPVAVALIVAIPKLDISMWKRGPIDENGKFQRISLETVDLPLFLSSLFWGFTGWDGLGCIAGEVSNPQFTYFFGTVLAIILVTGVTMAALIAGLAAPIKSTEGVWEEGYFVVAFNELLPHLGFALAIVALISNVGQYVSAIATTSRALYSMGDDGSEDEVDQSKVRLLPRAFHSVSRRTNSPVVAVISQSIIIAVLNVFSGFDLLVEVSVCLNCITLVLEFAAFLYMRYSEPNTDRPYRVPGGMFVAWFITLLKMFLVVGVISVTLIEERAVLIIVGGFNILVVVSYVARKIFWGYGTSFVNGNRNEYMQYSTMNDTKSVQAEGMEERRDVRVG